MNTNCYLYLFIDCFDFIAHTLIFYEYTVHAFASMFYRKNRERNTLMPDGDVNVYSRSCSFELTRGARRKPIMGNTGPSFGYTVKQIFNEIFFLRIVMTRPPIDARTNRKGKRGSGRRRNGRRANERACKYTCMYIKKGKKKERIRYPDRSCRTLDAGPIRGQGGPNLQDSGTGKNERER